MPLIDFREEEKKKSAQNFDQITIPKPPKSDRISSRSNYYGGGTTASGSPTSNTFDAFDHCATSADAISFTSAVSGGATSTDESKESSKSADSWHGSPPAVDPTPYHKTYYSVVPTESTTVVSVSENSRLYDQVPQDPDPFEIPSQIKDLTSAQRYSQIYSTINKRSPTRIETMTVVEATNLKHSLIVGEPFPAQTSSTSVSPKKSTVIISPPSVSSSPTRIKLYPSSTTTPYGFRQSDVVSTSIETKISPFSNASTPSLSQQSTVSSTSSISIETPPFLAQNYFTYDKRRSIPPDVPSLSATIAAPRSNNMANDFALRQSLLSAELSSRLNLNPQSPITNLGNFSTNQTQFNVWRMSGGATTPTVAAYEPTYASTVNSSTWNNFNSQKQQAQQNSWQASQQNARTFSEPDVSRSSGVLQPISARKLFDAIQ